MSTVPKSTTLDKTTENMSSEASLIRLELDGKPLCRYNLDHSNFLATLRLRLEQQYSDQNWKQIKFVDTDDYPVCCDDEENTLISELLSDKNNLIKLQTDKKEKNAVPSPRSKAFENKSDFSYLSLSNSTSANLRDAVKLPGSMVETFSNDIPMATDFDLNKWKTIFNNCSLLRGFRLNDTEPQLAYRSLFEFIPIENCLPMFNINEISYVCAYMTDKKTDSALVSSKIYDGGLDISFPFIGIGINAEYLKSKAKTTEERTVYSTCTFNFPRVHLELDTSYLKLTTALNEAVENIFQQPPTEQMLALKNVLSIYGHVYPKTVVLGGQLFHTETHKVKSDAEEEKEKIAVETRFKKSFHFKTVDVTGGVGGQTNENSKKESFEQSSEVTFQAIGGNTLLCSNPGKWTTTVAKPELWRVIEYNNFQPVISLLTEQQQNKIKEMIENSKIRDARWSQNGTTVAGGNGRGIATNKLNSPLGLFVDDDQTVIIADQSNHRIIQWKKNDTNGQVIAGGNGQGNRLDQLYWPTDVLIDKETNSLIIADRSNRRVMRWSRLMGTTQGEILIDNIRCWGLALDDQRYLYVSDVEKHEVRRYQLDGDKNRIVVAGRNGRGERFNELSSPTYLFVDQQQNVYVSDFNNHRVMKWAKNAKEGIVVAGGKGRGNALTQLSQPNGLFVDTLGTLYVADYGNDRVLRWPQGAPQGTVIVGGNGREAGDNQFNGPVGLFFDRHSNLYVVDHGNSRVQRFAIE